MKTVASIKISAFPSRKNPYPLSCLDKCSHAHARISLSKTFIKFLRQKN